MWQKGLVQIMFLGGGGAQIKKDQISKLIVLHIIVPIRCNLFTENSMLGSVLFYVESLKIVF